MLKDVSALKKEFENIQVPQELDLYIQQAIRKGRRVKTTGRIFKPLAAVISLVLVFALSVNLSPAFASYVSDMGMESLVNLFSFDKGLVNVVERGFGQIIDKSATDKGITLTVESAIYDGRKLLIAVKIESDRELEVVWLENPRLRGITGKNSTNWPCHGAENNPNVFWHFLEYEIDAKPLQDELFFECTTIEVYYCTHGDYIHETLSGNWAISFQLDKDLAKYEPKHLAVNKLVSIGEAQFTIEYVEIYPTVIDMKISLEQSNPVRFTSFKNPRLIDTDGNEYTFKSSSKRGNDLILSLESTYFTGATDLTFAIDGVYTLPLEETYFIIDIENECVLADGGLGIEYVGKSFFNYHEGSQHLNVWFKLTDRDFEEADEQFLWIDQRVHDLSGNPYEIIFCRQSNQYGLGFDVSQGIPAAVKVEVTGIPKGIMKPVRVKLKTD